MIIIIIIIKRNASNMFGIVVCLRLYNSLFSAVFSRFFVACELPHVYIPKLNILRIWRVRPIRPAGGCGVIIKN